MNINIINSIIIQIKTKFLTVNSNNKQREYTNKYKQERKDKFFIKTT